MGFTKTLTLAATLAVATAQAAPSHTFSSSVTLNGLHYELIDLNPNDGIAPGVTFALDGNAASVEMIRRGQSTSGSDTSTAPYGSAFYAAMLDGGNSSIAAAGWSASGLNLVAQGNGGRVGERNGVLTSFEASATPLRMTALLSPNTEMRWTGTYVARAFADKWFGTDATQAAGAELRISFGDLGTTTPETLSFAALAYANPQLGENWMRKAGTVGFSITNTTSNWSQYQASVVATAMGGFRPPMEVGVAPIPEPGTYALMAAGLGVVGFVARRRKVASE